MEETTITGVTSQMQGVGKLENGRAVFVPGALPGERVSIKITRDAGRFCEAAICEIIEASPHRIAPPCAYYGICGGCQLLHADMECALEMKRTRVTDALMRLGGLTAPNVLPTLGCEITERSRNKAEYPIENGVIGMRPAGGGGLVPIDDCLLQDKLSIEIMNCASELAKGTKLNGWLVTRVNRAGEGMAIISSAGRAPGWLKKLADVPGVVSVYHCALSHKPTHALDGACAHISGARTIQETLCGLKFDISPQTFFQVNTPQAERLYELAIKAAKIDEGAKMLDAYCGCGTISLAAARYAKGVLGVEIVAPAIDDARKNAEMNGLSGKARFICGDAGKEIPKLLKAGERFGSVIVDPPRKGCDPALLQALIAARPAHIAYVSCDPGTLARDIKLLAAGGYGVDWAAPVDMFPHTAHVETVVLLSRQTCPQTNEDK